MRGKLAASADFDGACPALGPPAPSDVASDSRGPVEPFAFQQDGKAAGFSIELWDRIAKETGQDYELHWTKSVGDVITAVKNGDADVGVAAISITKWFGKAD